MHKNIITFANLDLFIKVTRCLCKNTILSENEALKTWVNLYKLKTNNLDLTIKIGG